MSQPRFPFSPSDDPVLRDNIEHLRRGTVDTYESDWIKIESDNDSNGINLLTHVARTFNHRLGQVPLSVDVSVSESPGGGLAHGAVEGSGPPKAWDPADPQDEDRQDGNGYYNLQKNKDSITVVNTTGRDMYFRVRAR